MISGDHNDPPHYAPWTDKQRQQAHIDSFKLPLGSADNKHSPLALLIVKSMLLTGFDAPQAQVLYLDRLIQEAELLQAIARVNRTASKSRTAGSRLLRRVCSAHPSSRRLCQR